MVLAAGSLQIRAIDGAVLHPLEPTGVANVLFFVSTDCPVANGYAPEIQRICGAYAARGIACSLVYEDATLTAGDVRKHLDEYRYHGVAAAIDADGSLAAAVHATITPQAVVVDRRGTVRYSGRIDNFYAALGRPRRARRPLPPPSRSARRSRRSSTRTASPAIAPARRPPSRSSPTRTRRRRAS